MNKKSLFAAGMAAFLFLFPCFFPPLLRAGEVPVIEIRGGEVLIDGVPFDHPPTVKDLQHLFGPELRIYQTRYHDAYVFDRLGLALGGGYARDGEVLILYYQYDDDMHPAAGTSFGYLPLETSHSPFLWQGREIQSFTSPAEIESLGGEPAWVRFEPGPGMPPVNTTLTADLGTFRIHVRFNQKETAVGQIMIFWPRPGQGLFPASRLKSTQESPQAP